MEQGVRKETTGPSYWDVSAYVHELREANGTGTRWTLVPPVQRLDGRGYSSWCVAVEVWSLRTKEPARWHAQAGFGHGGAWKTLPAAMLATLRAVEAQWEDERRAALAQQRF